MVDTLRGERGKLTEGLPGARMERSKRLVFNFAEGLLLRLLLDRYAKLRALNMELVATETEIETGQRLARSTKGILQYMVVILLLCL